VIGDIGTDMHVEYLAFGDAVNVAARLESSAEPGAILISEGTHRLVGQQFPCEAVTGLKVRGKRKPLTAFRVTGPPVRIGRARGVEALETVFIGRSEELKTLQACLAMLDSGTGSVVTIEGEAGLGKSRLLAEFRASIPQGKVRWVEGHCLSFGGSMPYMLWIDLLSGLLGIQGMEGGETIARCYKARLKELAGDQASALHPYLSRLLSIPIEQDESIEIELLDRTELRQRTFQAVRSLLEAAAKKEPFVLVYEDLHWADPTSLELLSDLIADVLQPVLILCTFRPGHSRVQDPAWKRALEQAGERHHHLKLDPFGTGESRILVEGLLGSCDLPPTLQERIETRAEGNPFFVEEVIRSLIDAGDLQIDQEADCWKLVGEDALVHIPDTLEGVLLARIDRLGQETKRVLQMASVIGRTFLRRLLLVLTEESKELDKRLGELQTQEMIREYSTDPELEYIFKHHLFQEACYRTLLKKERLQYHRQLAQAIEALFPEWTEENPAMLAYHWKHAGEWERALDYYIQAGIKAQIESSLIEAIELYQEALDLAVNQNELEHEAQIRMKLGLLYNTAHQFDQAQ
ncbi:MAG: ATP-binding protein, partial [Anaerolineales bacterium]